MIENLIVVDYEFEVHGKLMKFPYKVYYAVIMDDRVIVSFSWGDLERADPKSEYWCTVWCYDLEGYIMWKVESPCYINKKTNEKIVINDGSQTVSGIRYDEKDKIFITFGSYCTFELDPDTGKLGKVLQWEKPFAAKKD